MEHTDSTSPGRLRTVDETERIIRRRLESSDWSPRRIAAEIHAAAPVCRLPEVEPPPAVVRLPIFERVVATVGPYSVGVGKCTSCRQWHVKGMCKAIAPYVVVARRWLAGDPVAVEDRGRVHIVAADDPPPAERLASAIKSLDRLRASL